MVALDPVNDFGSLQAMASCGSRVEKSSISTFPALSSVFKRSVILGINSDDDMTVEVMRLSKKSER